MSFTGKGPIRSFVGSFVIVKMGKLNMIDPRLNGGPLVAADCEKHDYETRRRLHEARGDIEGNRGGAQCR